MIERLKKLTLICLLTYLLLSHSVVILAAQNIIKAPLMFGDFENDSNTVVSTLDATVTLEDTDFGKTAKMEILSSGEPSITKRSIIIENEEPVDVSTYKYVTLWVRNSTVSSARISLIDAEGNSIEGVWTQEAKADQWTQLSVEISKFSSLDLTRITGIYIGQRNMGTYFISSIEFSDMKLVDNLPIAPGAVIEVTPLPEVDGDIEEIPIQNSPVSDTGSSDTYSTEEIYEYFFSADSDCNMRGNQGPTVAQTFEDRISFQAANNASGEIVDTMRHNGTSSLAYTKTKTGDPEIHDGSIRIDFKKAINAEHLRYLIFYVYDTQGSNNMKISLIDGSGAESDFAWRKDFTIKDTWAQYYVNLEEFNGIDKTNIVGVRIGQWNIGTYYIDDIYFDNYLTTAVPELIPMAPESNFPSHYQFRDLLSVSYSNNSCADMYYTTDGTIPTKDSNRYTDEIVITDTTTISIVSYKYGYYSDIQKNTFTKNPAVPSDVIAGREAGRYKGAIDVPLSNNEGHEIYYTIDGSEPDNNSIKYTSPIKISRTTEIKAVSYDGDTRGNTVSFKYTLPLSPHPIATNRIEKQATNLTIELIMAGIVLFIIQRMVVRQ